MAKIVISIDEHGGTIQFGDREPTPFHSDMLLEMSAGIERDHGAEVGQDDGFVKWKPSGDRSLSLKASWQDE